MDRYDAIVLGAGISGMVTASILIEQGRQKILLIDEYDHLGGNHISRDIGPYSFDIGSFIFHDDSPFFKRFPALLARYLPFDGATGRIDPQGALADYPFDLKIDLLGAGPAEIIRIFASLLFGRLTKNPENNALEFVTYWLGDYLARRTGLISYLGRFYAADPSLIEGIFAKKRMRWVSANASLKGQIRKLRAQNGPRNRSMVRPRCGFNDLYAGAGTVLKQKGVEIVLGQSIQSVRRDTNGVIEVRASGLVAASPIVVSTVPLPFIARWCGMDADDRIQSSTLTSLFYSFHGKRAFAHYVLYNFSTDGHWKRLTMHSDCYGKANGREYFSVEVVSTDMDNNVERFHRNFSAHAKSSGIFDGDLVLEGSETTASAYPVYLEGATASAEKMIDALRAYGVLSLGRQGGFDYQPTAHVSVATAEKILGAAK